MEANPFDAFDAPNVFDQFDASIEIGPPAAGAPAPESARSVPAATRARFLGLGLPTEYDSTQAAKGLPLAGGIVGAAAVPGAGWGALALQSLSAGLGTEVGEFGRQAIAGEKFDPRGAIKRGGEAAAFNFGAGTLLKTLGFLAKRLFSFEPGPDLTQAAEFAKTADEGLAVPFPLSSAAPGSPAAKVAGAANMTIAGQLKNHSDAVKVGQYINRGLAGVETKAQALDEASAAAQQVVKTVFNERGAITRAMDTFKTKAGADAEIPIPNLQAVLPKVLQQLSRAGGSRTESGRVIKQLMRYHGNEAAEGAGFLKPQDIDDLLFIAKPKAGARRMVQEALIKDLDAYAESIGMQGFGGELRGAIQSARKTLELGNEIEGLQALAESADGIKTITWANRMMANPRAREWLRKTAPEKFHDLADAWAANGFYQAVGPSKVAIGQGANGARARAWFEQNREAITEYLGKPQAAAWDNFTLYMRYMDKAWQAGARPLETNALLGKAAAEVGAAFAKPAAAGLLIPSEGAAFMLARGLNDPTSRLFRLFTQGVPASTRSFWIKAAGISGQAAADAKD